ncbi:hypothetical protein H0H81_000829 [Sphagnurus paluster]|uniref:Helicase associated domain-containing protein n=1 Tax=Sphagnurus paluster TaxID=117069 RepID=A0A9P7FTZ2_9AGAR|nr:hypothetical protein H0H81_000829 [Sphagnurus paluster]
MSLKFWKPGTAGPGSNLDRATEVEGNLIPSAPAYSSLSVQAQRERLPIFKHREKLLYCVERYGIDEAHERSIYSDLLLGVLKKIRRKRPSLRLIVSSATLDATAFLDYFTDSANPNDAIIVSLEGRMYPVEVAYLEEPTPDYVRTAAQISWNINLSPGPGDILVFLTGREEIERCLEELSEMIPTTYNPTTALASLSTVPTSVASATQRAGRAGRTSPGVCYRLYPLAAFESLPYSTPAEITRVDMTTPILQLKSLGIDDLMKFEWVSAPPAEIALRALESLVAAGMVGDDGRLTPMGQQVAECPVEVGIARMVNLLIRLDFRNG